MGAVMNDGSRCRSWNDGHQRCSLRDVLFEAEDEGKDRYVDESSSEAEHRHQYSCCHAEEHDPDHGSEGAFDVVAAAARTQPAEREPDRCDDGDRHEQCLEPFRWHLAHESCPGERSENRSAGKESTSTQIRRSSVEEPNRSRGGRHDDRSRRCCVGAVLLEAEDENQARDEDETPTDAEQPTGNPCRDSDECCQEGSRHGPLSVEPGAIVTLMLRLLAVVAVATLLVGCSQPPEEPTTTTTTLPGAGTPDGALRDLLSAVVVGDYSRASEVTDSEQVALLIALDGATLSEATAMLEDGIPEASLAAFWASFQDTYGRSVREELDDMLVAEGRTVTVDGVEFANIEVALRKGRGLARWIAYRDGSGRWRVDLFATFGPTVALPMRLWLATLPDDQDVRVVRSAIADQRPSLLAALQQQPLGPISPGVAEQIRGLLVDVGATAP